VGDKQSFLVAEIWGLLKKKVTIDSGFGK